MNVKISIKILRMYRSDPRKRNYEPSFVKAVDTRRSGFIGIHKNGYRITRLQGGFFFYFFQIVQILIFALNYLNEIK